MSFNPFQKFVAKAAHAISGSTYSSDDATPQEQLPVESLSVETTPASSDAVTLQATVGLRTITLNVSPETTYAEAIKLSQVQIPGFNMAAESITVLDTSTNEVVRDLSQPIRQNRSVAFESTSGTAG